VRTEEVKKALPLTESATFRAVLQRRNKVQVPMLVRWFYKLEPDQVLRVTVCPLDDYEGGEQEFLARMTRDGRLTIPKLTVKLFQEDREESLVRSVLEVTVEPADQESSMVKERDKPVTSGVQ
jgi:bifunctional DNA-binding transcriptional regulator/antitoxin component of YhaV-PrlF toxin-antitoxin module